MGLVVFSPTAILGYGFPRENVGRAARLGIDVIGVDGGSSDPGPYYLGSGEPFVAGRGVERDLELLLRLQAEVGAPIVVTTAGGSGAGPHVEWALGRLARAAARAGRRVRAALVYTDVGPGLALDLYERGLLEPAGRAPPGLRPSGGELRVVAQVGLEPVMEALRRFEPDVVLAGRAVDVAAFAAVPVLRGYPRELAVHMGKILECGALAAEPGSGSDSMVGVLERGSFTVFPLSPGRRATVTSVMEHSLYEREDPFREYVPGGFVDLSRAVYEQVDERSVRVSGSVWVDLERYLVKLEAAELEGCRYVSVAGARDPGFIRVLPRALEEARRAVRESVGREARLYFRVYGWNAVLGPSEPGPGPGHEVGVMIEAVAPSPGQAKDAVALARAVLLHYGFPGRKTTAGNLAFPTSPSDYPAGEAYRWALWHLYEPPDRLWPARFAEACIDSSGRVEVGCGA